MFLNFIQTSDDRIAIDQYNLIRADHLCDSKRGGFVFIIKSIFL